jgi:hypothetical protein
MDDKTPTEAQMLRTLAFGVISAVELSAAAGMVFLVLLPRFLAQQSSADFLFLAVPIGAALGVRLAQGVPPAEGLPYSFLRHWIVASVLGFFAALFSSMLFFFDSLGVGIVLYILHLVALAVFGGVSLVSRRRTIS